MRVLLTADPVLPVPPTLYGGIERIVASLIDHLRSRGHTVGLVAHEGSTVTTDFFAPWPVLNAHTLAGHGRNMRALCRAVDAFRPDVLHSFSRLLYLLPLLRRELPKIMSYQRQTGGHQIRIAARLGGESLQFTGCSDFIAGMGRPAGGTWHAIPNFVETDKFSFAPAVAADAPLVFLSRVERIKGAHIAIEAARRSGRRLVIAGNVAPSGPDRQYWEEEILSHIGHDGIEYVGPVDDAQKIALLGSALAMIVPIQWDEPFGIVFAESLACGTPVISCPRGALPEILREGIDGMLVETVDAACAAIHAVSALDRAQCRQRAVEAFSAGAVVGRYERLYRSAIGLP